MWNHSRQLSRFASASLFTSILNTTTFHDHTSTSCTNESESHKDKFLTKQPSFGATVNLRKKIPIPTHSKRIADVDSILLIPGTAHTKLALEISELIDVPNASVNISRFADGEVNVVVNDSIRGKNVFIIQTCAAPVNDNIMELLLTISCARRSGAKRIFAVIPYYGYKHHRRFSPISTKNGTRFLASGAMDFAKMLTVMGVDRVIAIDLQRPGQGSEACFFDNVVPLESIGTSQFMMDYLISRVQLGNNIVVVAPNAECIKKARQCQGMLEQRLKRSIKVSCFFQSDSSTGPTDPDKLHTLDGMSKFEDADVIIVDDMIDSAGTLCTLANKIQQAGAKNIYACASHGVFTGDAVTALESSHIRQVFITDSLPLPSTPSTKIVQMPIAPLLARVILAEHFRSISDDAFEEDDLSTDTWSQPVPMAEGEK